MKVSCPGPEGAYICHHLLYPLGGVRPGQGTFSQLSAGHRHDGVEKLSFPRASSRRPAPGAPGWCSMPGGNVSPSSECPPVPSRPACHDEPIGRATSREWLSHQVILVLRLDLALEQAQPDRTGRPPGMRARVELIASGAFAQASGLSRKHRACTTSSAAPPGPGRPDTLYRSHPGRLGRAGWWPGFARLGLRSPSSARSAGCRPPGPPSSSPRTRPR